MTESSDSAIINGHVGAFNAFIHITVKTGVGIITLARTRVSASERGFNSTEEAILLSAADARALARDLTAAADEAESCIPKRYGANEGR